MTGECAGLVCDLLVFSCEEMRGRCSVSRVVSIPRPVLLWGVIRGSMMLQRALGGLLHLLPTMQQTIFVVICRCFTLLCESTLPVLHPCPG
jgi:hypothetical protein